MTGTVLGAPVSGYEMHMGETAGTGTARAFGRIGRRAEGAISADGRVMGSYVHGLLASADFRRALLSRLGGVGGGVDYHAAMDGALDAIAAELERRVAIDALLALAREASDR